MLNRRRSTKHTALPPLFAPVVWVFCGILLFGTAVLVGTGHFAHPRQLSLLSLVAGGGTLLFCALAPTLPALANIQPPRTLLLVGQTVSIWLLFRLFYTTGWHSIMLPSLLYCRIATKGSTYAGVLSFFTGLAMELLLVISGHQSTALFLAHQAYFSLLLLLVGPSLIPALGRKAPGPQRRISSDIPTSPSPQSAPAAAFVKEDAVSTSDFTAAMEQGVERILTVFQHVLGVDTLLILEPGPQGLTIRHSVSNRSRDLVGGPFPHGHGFIGGLRRPDQRQISLAPVTADSPRLPYYRNNSGVGAVIAERLRTAAGDFTGLDKYPLLCGDRASDRPWQEEERQLFHRLAELLSSFYTIQHQGSSVSLERDHWQRLFLGLKELNSVLDLQAVFPVCQRIIAAFLPISFFAITLVEDRQHHVVFCHGEKAMAFQGRHFALEDGLIGQVVKRNHWLPAGGQYREDAPIFSRTKRVGGLRSLLILPLPGGNDGAMGTLVFGARQANLFQPARRQLLELVATQVAVKIDLAQAHEKIRLLATTDGLTGLTNHRTFQHAFDMMLERTRRNHCPLCLLLCDIDFFKGINDTYGHPFGDQVLRQVAKVLKNAVRRVDVAARYGGEEFALLLEGADEKGGRLMAERIRTEIERLVIPHRKIGVPVTISLGLAFSPRDADDKERLIRYADQALYKAKAAGRNRTVCWSEIQAAEEPPAPDSGKT